MAEKFSTYNFEEYIFEVLELLKKVCAVSVRTVDIVDGMGNESRKARS